MPEAFNPEELACAPPLDELFLLYIGPVNATAINRFDEYGNRRAYDQHAVTIVRADIPDIDVWEEGTLKVYCPSILLAFPPGEELKLLNALLHKAEPLLYDDTPLLTAVRATATPDEYESFVTALERYVEDNQQTADLAQRALTDNVIAFDRSIRLQRMFVEENEREKVDNLDVRRQAALTLARQKAIFTAMAPHYAVEATFDDQFAHFPYHLPDHVQRAITENAPMDTVPYLDRQAYERGLANSMLGAPNPDIYRFDPVLASLIAPFVVKKDGTFEHYDDWEDFQTRVISIVEDQTTLQAIDFFAKGMNIPREFAFFAAFKMCQKEVRKRGIKRLYSPEDAKARALQIAQEYETTSAYFRSRDPYLRLNYYEENSGGFVNAAGHRLTKKIFQRYRQAIVDRTAIEYVNAFIGTYKFIPWVKDDGNFIGMYLPYAVMKTEKARIVTVLCSEEFSPYWREKGFWFRDALPQLIASHPSMYSKWFLPLLEKGMIDESIADEAAQHANVYLHQLAQQEAVQK